MHFFLLTAQTAVPEEINFGMLLLRTFFFLAVVLVLIYFVLRKVVPFLVQAPGFRNRTVKILERVAIDQKRSLLVVDIQDRVYLLASAEGQINVLMELDREKLNIPTVAAVAHKTTSFEDVLKKTLLRRKSSETPEQP